MKLQIDWKKIKYFFFWLVNRSQYLVPPVKCRIIKSKKKSLVGRAYYFCDLENWRVKSPLKGVISRIYPNYALQITNKDGLQILLSIQVDRKNPVPLEKILQCEVKEGQEVDPKTTLFIIYLEEQVISVTVYIPWQPEILGRIEDLRKNDPDCFVKFYYRNPYMKLRLKKHGKY